MKTNIVKGKFQSVEGHPKLNGKKVIFLKETQSRTPNPHNDVVTPPKPRKAPAWFQDFDTRINSRFDKLELRVTNLESNVKNVQNTIRLQGKKLDRVITLNNLKTE